MLPLNAGSDSIPWDKSLRGRSGMRGRIGEGKERIPTEMRRQEKICFYRPLLLSQLF